MEDIKKLLQYASQPNLSDYTSFMKTLTNALASLALYVTIALALALVVWAIVVRNRDEQYLAGVRKTMTGIVVGYSLGVIFTIGTLRLLRDVIKGDITWHFWLLVGLFILVLASVVAVSLLQKKQISCVRYVAPALLALVGVYVVVVLCVVKPVEADYAPKSGWLMYLLSAILVAAMVVLSLVGSPKKGYNTKALTYAAICIALSFALSYIKFFSMPQGGSVTFASLLPLALYSYMFGTRRGVIAGVVYGLLQFVQSPQFYQPMQVLLDYPIAFASIGLAGIGKRFRFLHGKMRLEFALGTTVAVLFRYLAHLMSGYFVFYSWAEWAGYNSALIYSLAYNSYTLVDLAIVLLMGVLALCSKPMQRIVVEAEDSSAEAIAAPAEA